MVKFFLPHIVCMLQESPFKQGPAGISPQGVRMNHFSSPVTSAAGMTQVEVRIGIRTDIRTMDTKVAAVSTVTRIMKEMHGATDMVRQLGKTAGHIESTGIMPIQVTTKDSLETELKRMKTEVIGMTGQAMVIQIQMAGMCMTGDMTGVIKAAARMLMSVTDTDSIRPNFSVRRLMLTLPCGCCM